MISKEDIKSDLMQLKSQIGKIPSKVMYDQSGCFSTTTVRKKFGNWSSAIEETFGIQRQQYKPPKIISCFHCDQPTRNPKFCSSSCAATFNNLSKKIGRKKTKHTYCKYCGTEIEEIQNKFCKDCSGNIIKSASGKLIRIEVARKKDFLTPDTQKYRRIREHARKIAHQQNMLNECQICGYSLHVECAHKKPINKFADDTLISMMNRPSNLIGLCRNHHWEFDHGYLSLREI